MLSPEDKEWLHLSMKNAAYEAMDKHRKEDHDPIDEKLEKMGERVDDTRKMVYAGTSLAAALGAAIGRWLPGGGS